MPSDKRTHVVRFRKGKPVLVDKQILRWRKANKKREDTQDVRDAKAAQEEHALLKMFK